ncbi:MAG: helix-turn-helix domain-containing protein [Pseudomonadota bacterium]
MPSLFSARTFADRAAQRGAVQETKDSAKPADKPTHPDFVEPKANSTKGNDKAPAITPPQASGAVAPDQARNPGVAEAPASYKARRTAIARAGHKDGQETPISLDLVSAPARKPATLLTPLPPAGALRLMPLQALSKGGRWRTEAMRSYRMPVLYWFTRGQGRITLAGLTRGYGAHNAVFVPPRCMHGFEVTAQVYGTAVFFHEDHGLPLPSDPLHLRIRESLSQGEITTILEQLTREIEGDRLLRERAIHNYAGLLTVWLDRQAAEAGQGVPQTAALRLVRRFTEMVEAQLYTGQGVSDYAEALGVTPTHLSRVCRDSAGRSASDILADRMTYEARRLLAETTLPIKQVAQILGFGSAAYFTRAFQNRTGQTPSQFRAAA